ncbi:hypothetical protein [Clostridium felsineum]|uniref:hypothetical protein n=1 Tax=Clostridium felsineum TaxID=36839 RepID=UPI00098C123C|nr:hypothetical protein [Clostridium felsineum]URZ16569.1 hypothetical protein CLFE_026160 [Clostridium felsineum DSM 794]
MATSGCILKKKDDYIVENSINDIKKSIFNAKLKIRGENIINHKNGEFCCLNLGIFDHIAFNRSADDFGNEEVEQGQSLNFYIDEINESYTDMNEFDWVLKGDKLCKIAFIENVIDNEQIVFKFIHEYLKINPQDYFWVEDDWVYTFEDMEKLSKLPYDECWCYKNPNDKLKDKN